MTLLGLLLTTVDFSWMVSNMAFLLVYRFGPHYQVLKSVYSCSDYLNYIYHRVDVTTIFLNFLIYYLYLILLSTSNSVILKLIHLPPSESKKHVGRYLKCMCIMYLLLPSWIWSKTLFFTFGIRTHFFDIFTGKIIACIT